MRAISADDRDTAFREFVLGSQTRMVAFAEFLVGDRYGAQDLVQEAYVAAYAKWGRINPDSLEPYVRRCIVNGRIDWWRRRSSTEAPSGDPRDFALESRADRTGEIDQRLLVIDALARLTNRERSVLVMRHYLGLSEAEIDALIGRGRRRRHRRLTTAVSLTSVVVAGTVIGVVVAASGSSPNPSTGANGPLTKTRVIDYTPFTSAGTIKPGVRVTTVKHGSCTHHKDDQRSDMFDCTVTHGNNSDEDGPCFYGTHAPGLFCPINAEMTRGYEVVPDIDCIPPSGPNAARSTTPFDLLLTNGASCFPFSVPGVHAANTGNAPVSYLCANGAKTPPSDYSYAFGAIGRRSAIWTVQCRTGARGDAPAHAVGVAAAYY